MDDNNKRILDQRLVDGDISIEEYQILLSKLIGSETGNEITQKESVTVSASNERLSQKSVKSNQNGQTIERINNKVWLFRILFFFLFLTVILGAGYGILNYHFVKTSSGIKIYEKKTLSLNDTYVDMTTMSFVDLRKHTSLVEKMTSQGDVEYIPGGESLKTFMENGQEVLDVIKKYDNEYELTNSLEQIRKIGTERYNQLDKEYDISNKTRAIGEKMKEEADKLNEWLGK